MRISFFTSAVLATLLASSAAFADEPRVELFRGPLVPHNQVFGRRASGAELESMARALVAERSTAEMLHASTSELADGTRVVRLAQAHRGLPVAQRGATVTFGKDGVARLLALHAEVALPDDIAPRVAAVAAARTAGVASGLAINPQEAILAIWPGAGSSRLAWVFQPTPIGSLAYAPVVVVDAKSGELILRYNAIRTLDQAQVYPTNPVKSPTLADVTLPVDSGATTLLNTLVKSSNCIDQHGTKTYQGITVHICDPLPTATPDTNGDYLIAPGTDTAPEDAFSEVSMFWHANRAYSFFRALDPTLDVNGGKALPTVSNLRIPQGLTTLNLAQMADPNLPLVPFQNAFFAPTNPLFAALFGITGGAMWFGQGPIKDYSYDGDVIYHEFTHSVVNVTLKLIGTPHMDAYGASWSPGAMNEGLADYFSSAIAGDPDVGEYASQDLAPGLTAIRTLDNQDSCPAAIGGEVHQDSTLFSGALWQVRATLQPADQTAYDLAVFTAMNSAPSGDLGYEDFAQLVTSALDASTLGSTVADALRTAFTNRGVLPQCTRVLEYTGNEMTGPLQTFWFTPGKTTTGVAAPGWTPGVVQFHVTLPDDTGSIRVSFQGFNSPDPTSQLLGGGGSPFSPKVLVGFGSPLTFSYTPLDTPEGAVLAKATGGPAYEAIADVPAGETDAYVMIVNAGDTDGRYTSFSIQVEPGGPSASAGAGAGTGSGAGGGSATPEATSGCGCRLPAAAGGAAPWSAAALAALGLAIGRLRRRRTA